MQGRISDLTAYAAGLGVDGILFTCSAFGRAIENAAKLYSVPVMKPNEARFDQAFGYGDNIAMIYTFLPAALGMEEEFRQTADATKRLAVMRSYYASGALEAKKLGDEARHTQAIANTAAKIQQADAIMLAQFSMASAAEAVRKLTNKPVLVSPELAVIELRRRVAEYTKMAASFC